MTSRRSQLRNAVFCVAIAIAGEACAGSPAPAAAPGPARGQTSEADGTAVRVTPRRDPLLPPQFARLAGLMPLRSTGADVFVADNPTFDGRGVLIGILDSGIDAGVPGLRETPAGDPKIADLRDFSGEGHIALREVAPDTGDGVWVDDQYVAGFSRLAGLTRAPVFGGLFRERPLGVPPGADVNGDGDNEDVFPVLVARASDGWVVLTDTDGDGTLANERPVRDFRVAGETFAYGPLTIAVNLTEQRGEPRLELFFDNSGHGTHVAGIAAGHDLFGVSGFDGVAPGARILGLKISNNARGGISVTGAMQAAMEYAAEFAAARNLPLVLNLSFGIGNAREGTAAIDSIIDAFALAHPDVLFVISAGNDGPGISTVDFPGSAEFALTVCALFPGVFARPPEPGVRPAPDVLGWWSGRGGETQKPDLCAPGVAFSNVPPWNAGGEVSGGTSMAAPQISGAAALLLSGLTQLGQPTRAVDLQHALEATATLIAGATVIDVGTGVPDVPAAFRWLRAAHQAGRFSIRALADGGNSSHASAAFRRNGLADPGDTLQRFTVAAIGGQPFARVLLRPDVPWLHAPDVLDFHGEPVTVTVTYDAAALTDPGLHVGTVWAVPETDTLGGAAFGLTNTVIVPETWVQSFTKRRYLEPGRSDRYFFRVTDPDGGLSVQVTVDPEREATLYLFEPGGRPFRETSSVTMGGDAKLRQIIRVRAEDAVPGVYEVVIVAPPLDGVTYELKVRRPRVTISVTPERALEFANRTPRRVEARLAAVVVGARRAERIRVRPDWVSTIRSVVPPWATDLVIDVRLDPELWSRVTDFGVTLFDTAGRLLIEEPLNYPAGRHRIAIDSLGADTFEIELLPAFASQPTDGGWMVEVDVTYLAETPLLSLTLGAGNMISIPAGGSITLPIVIPGSLIPLPEGFHPLLEVTAAAGDDETTRRVMVTRASGASR